MDVKSFFHAWCVKLGKTPQFEVNASGLKHRQLFSCEVRVDGYPYSGRGNSSNKKDAQFNAARDFVQYLVRAGHIKYEEVPSDTFNAGGTRIKQDISASSDEPPGRGKSIFEPNMKPDAMGFAYRPYRAGGNDSNSQYTYKDRIAEDHKLSRGAEDLDMNSSIHGNWTIENGKSRLHQYLQQNNIHGDYTYTIMESEGSRFFVAELSIYVKKLNRTLTGRESGSNKLSASKSCALSLVRQLYHLGVIEAFTGSLKKNRDKENQMKPYEVSISPELEKKVHDVLNELSIIPTVVDQPPELKVGDALSILNSTVLEDFISSKTIPAGVVSWSPPLINWNPWTCCNIDEGPLSTMSLDDISKELAISGPPNDETSRKIIQARELLPVATYEKEILQTIKENPVCIVRGSTGCGKTTQICQFILDDHIRNGRGAYCNVVVTQPKRISTVSVADRVAYERCESLGNSIGYSIRFESVLPRPFGSILFCTVATLLRKLENGLRGVSHVIVDEIHERDLNTDFILVILRDMVHTFPDLRVIIMSATADTDLFAKYFNGCPILELVGRLYPVTEYFLEDCVEMLNFKPEIDPRKRKRNRNSVRDDDDEELAHDDGDDNLNLVIGEKYKPQTREAMKIMSEKDINFDLICNILQYIRDTKVSGAVLIFLPGWSVIFTLMRYLQQHNVFGGPDYVILPLHSCLSREDQRRVFETFPPSITKLVLSTNIAESSITIDDVVYVIDSCKAKLKMFTSHNNLTHFATVWASKTNLEQRKGRAGRVRPGTCFHLCSRARYEKLEEHITPEMFRTPLHEISLAIKMLRLGSIGQFLSKAIEPPPIDAVIEAEVFLREMKCLDANDELTPLGRIIGHLPIEPRLGKMLILGCLFNCVVPLSVIAANSGTSTSVFASTTERRGLTYQQKSFAGVRCSDHIATLNVFHSWEGYRGAGSGVEYCERNMLAEPSLNITWEAKNQLLSLLMNHCGFPQEVFVEHSYNFQGPDSDLDIVIALLCIGFYPNVAYHMSKRKMITTGNILALIHKRSVNCSHLEQNFPLPFFVYGEKVRTKVVTCKQMSMVSPIHLLLFGARRVEYVDGVIRLDGWINLKMSPSVASAIVALRPALESLIIKASKEPSQIIQHSDTDVKVIRVIKELCDINAGRYGMEQISFSQKKCRSSHGPNLWTDPRQGDRPDAKRQFGDFKPFSSGVWSGRGGYNRNFPHRNFNGRGHPGGFSRGFGNRQFRGGY